MDARPFRTATGEGRGHDRLASLVGGHRVRAARPSRARGARSAGSRRSPQRRTQLRKRPMTDYRGDSSEPPMERRERMIRTTPFHERTRGAQPDPALESLVRLPRGRSLPAVATRPSTSPSATRPASSTRSPLYKYRITGPDAEAFLAGVLARDIRACPPGHAQYTCWLDDRGFVIEDGVILHPSAGRVPADQRPSPTSPTSPTASGGMDVAHRGGQRRDRHARAPGPALAATCSRGSSRRWSTSRTSASPRARSAARR